MDYKTTTKQPQMIFDKDSFSDLETQIQELDAEFKVREIEISFDKESYFFGQVKNSREVYNFLKERLLKGIEIQEYFVAIYLNQANKIIGYYHHSTGTINSTMVDVEIIAAVALKTLAKSVIISHNHPSRNLQPSDADKLLTKKIKTALSLFDIVLADHIIVSKDGYYSFMDERENSLKGVNIPNSMEQQLRQEILKQLKKITQANAPNLFSMLQSPQGYEQVEQIVITKVLHDQMVPAAIIPLLESELEMI